MMETDTPTYVNNILIENVESYMYLGQRYSTRDKNQVKKIKRRIKAEWNDLKRGNMGIHHPCKEQASSRTNKNGKEYMLNITYRER